VVNVTDRANVHVRLIPLKLTFCHLVASLLSKDGRQPRDRGRIAQPFRAFAFNAQVKMLKPPGVASDGTESGKRPRQP